MLPGTAAFNVVSYASIGLLVRKAFSADRALKNEVDIVNLDSPMRSVATLCSTPGEEMTVSALRNCLKTFFGPTLRCKRRHTGRRHDSSASVLALVAP